MTWNLYTSFTRMTCEQRMIADTQLQSRWQDISEWTKYKDTMIFKETWLKVFEMISNQESSKSLYVWTWFIWRYENAFYVSY